MISRVNLALENQRAHDWEDETEMKRIKGMALKGTQPTRPATRQEIVQRVQAHKERLHGERVHWQDWEW